MESEAQPLIRKVGKPYGRLHTWRRSLSYLAWLIFVQDIVKDDKSRPHRNKQLAEQGWREYWHVKDMGENSEIYHDKSNTTEATEEDLNKEDYEGVKKMISMGGFAPRMSSEASKPTCSGVVATWKGKALTTMQKLADEEVAAQLLALDLRKNLGGKVVQKKHVNVAEGWQKKLTTKRDHILKLQATLSSTSDAILKKEGNKYEQSLSQADEILDSWNSESNKQLLENLLGLCTEG